MQHHRGPSISLTAMIDGPVKPADRIQVFDELRKLCHHSTRPVTPAAARLFSDPTTRPRPVAIAECLVFIDDGLTDDERAVALAAWFEGFDRRTKRDIGVRAVDVLDEMRAEGEIL